MSRPVTEKPNVFSAVTAVTAVTAKNNECRENGDIIDVNAAGTRRGIAARPGSPTQPGLHYAARELSLWYAEQRDRRTGLDQDPLARALVQRLTAPGLSPYTILDLARWYEAEANRRRVGENFDQPALDRDLRRLLAERGVSPEFMAAEFERVMHVALAM
jgi:hypothetical protein